jgi:hypothetical protein
MMKEMSIHRMLWPKESVLDSDVGVMGCEEVGRS